MKLCADEINGNRREWVDKGYRLPEYDREAMIARSAKAPTWIHFGAGNIFRAFQANDLEQMLNRGEYDRGVIAVSGRDSGLIDRMYRPHDNLSILVTLCSDGSIVKRVIGSVPESLTMDFSRPEDRDRLRRIFMSESLQMASFTITEKGYAVTDSSGNLLPDIASDQREGPGNPVSYMGRFTSLLYERFLAGRKKIAVVSMDNCSHNGDLLRMVVSSFAQAWEERGLVQEGFVSYINDRQAVSFPCSMIDKITPRPDPSVRAILEADGIGDMDPSASSSGTYVAPFVNAEEPEYLVIEDDFPNGRPPLEKGGVIFTDRETVERCERMKVCTCLNPLHTALAVFGCLLGYTKISDEMKDPDLPALCEGVGYAEGLPVVTDPGILCPEEFMDTVLRKRFPNPFLPDSPQRIATDTSQKIRVRFGETVKAYMGVSGKEARDLKYIPLVFAGWIRYLMAVDDDGTPFERSADPLLEQLTICVSSFSLKESYSAGEAEEKIRPLLENEQIFGVNLYEAGLAEKVTGYFLEMIKGPGAVRRTLEKTVRS